MPQYKRGDMLKEARGIILVTTNSTLRKDGALVMGRGAAYEAKILYPGLEFTLGKLVTNKYGIILNEPIGAFQVKYFWGNKADLNLIAYSAALLQELAEANPTVTYNLNFPGIGNGGLKRISVVPIIEKLPNNVIIWEL